MHGSGCSPLQIRVQIRAVEHQIRVRSRMTEVHWSTNKSQQVTSGAMINRILDVLDALDRHNFNQVEGAGCLDVLYTQVFVPQPSVEDGEVKICIS